MSKHIEQKIRNELLEFGYFSEQIPPFFSSSGLVNAYNDLDKCIDKDLKNRQPTMLSIYKQENVRRNISIPNPETFLHCVKIMSENWSEILTLCDSMNSTSPITYVRQYNPFAFDEKISSENLRDHYGDKSDYIAGHNKSVEMSSGSRYKLSIDVSNCYNSIYTHSIAWAICGKEDTKARLREIQLYRKGHKEPSKFDQEFLRRYDFAEKLDKAISYQKYNETNGIVIGPFTSRIFSEIIFCAIDKELRKEFKFCRYVDDYRFYFRTEGEAFKGISTIAGILSQYNLAINSSKTKIETYPFDILDTLREKIEEARCNSSRYNVVENVLNTASQLFVEGNKGAYKYALKVLQGEELNANRINIVLPMLINIMLLDPKYGKYVVTFLQKNKNQLNIHELGKLINEELEDSIETKLQQEMLLFTYILYQLNMKITNKNFIDVLASKNDLAILIVLYMYKNHNDCLLDKYDSTIAECIKQLGYELSEEHFEGERWLLLYQCIKDDLLPKGWVATQQNNEFFDQLLQSDVSFVDD